MKKLICIKPHRDSLIKDEIYEYEVTTISSTKYNNHYSEYRIFCKEWKHFPFLTFSYGFVKEHFITLAEYRDIQINELFND